MFRIAQNKFFLPASWARAFAVTLVFVTLASSLFWLDFFRSYRAEMTVLVVSKIGITHNVADSLAALTRTLSFYERVLADNDLIDDEFAGYVPNKRKALWNETVSVKQEDKSGTLVILATGDTPEQARRLAQQVARTMFAVAGLYYNVKTDVDMRIIDGPIAARAFDNILLFSVTSILTGFCVTVVFFWLLKMVPGFIGGPRKSIDLGNISAVGDKTYLESEIGETVPWIDPRTFVPAKPKTLSFENVVQETQGAPATRTAYSAKRAQAPLNLPIADDTMDLPVADEDSLPFEFEAWPAATESYRGEPEDIELSFAEPISDMTQPETERQLSEERDEPTVEEYKRRLNELLSGGK